MSISVSYDQNGKMMLDGLVCSCGCVHHPLDSDIYVGENLLPNIPAYIRSRGLGTHCVLVADDTTYAIAGCAAETALRNAGFSVVPCVLHREDEALPDDLSCGEVLLSVTEETEFLLSVGSGTITDTTRINAKRTGLPFVAVGTAPSMDGYTSAVAPLLHHGVKIQTPAVSPDIIVCDLGILGTAPDSMIASGVGDVLGKYIAMIDWRLGNIINDEEICPLCTELVTNAVNALVKNIDEIRARTPNGMRLLIEALLLSGATVLIIGHTRAVASIEHNIAQYWEMMMIQRGLKPPMHGASVGVATLLVWPFYERFLQQDLSLLDFEKIRARRLSDARRKEWLYFAYGKEGGTQIIRNYPDDFLTWEEQKRHIVRAQQNEERIRTEIRKMPRLQEIENTLKKLNADLTADDEQIPADLLNCSMWCGKDYRTRYTIFKLLDECGLLPEYLSEYPCAFFGQND